MAAEKRCCVKTCGSDTEILHKFPNPEKDIDRFNTWKRNVGGEILSLQDTYILKYRKVCHLHFKSTYHTRNKKLSANAIPTLCLPGLKTAEIQESTPTRESKEICPFSQPSCSKANGTLSTIENPLIDETLTFNSNPLEKNINKDVTQKWTQILSKGLPKEETEKLLTEYSVPADCQLFTAPILNSEPKAALSTMVIKRDNMLMDNQKLLGAAFSALSQAINITVSNNSISTEILKPITDACRILCQCHYSETELRRNFITSAIHSKLKGAFIESSPDRYLFGENLSDKLKAAKNVQQSGALKHEFNRNKCINTVFSGNHFVNSRNMYRGKRVLQRNIASPKRGVLPPSLRKRCQLQYTPQSPIRQTKGWK